MNHVSVLTLSHLDWPSGCYFVSFKAFTSKQTYPTILLHLNWNLQRPLGFNDTNQVYVYCTLYCLSVLAGPVWVKRCMNFSHMQQLDVFLEQIYYKSSFGGFPFIFLLSHLHPFTCPAQRMSPICKIMITQICIFFESPLNTERINWKSIVVDIIMMERKGLKVSLLHSLCPGTLVSNCLKPCQRAIWKTSLIHK